MTDKEALKLALEALELLTGAWQTFDALDYGDNAITAIKEALAEHAMRETQRLGQEIEQEPVACKTLSLEIKLPVGFMNAGVSVNNFFTADTNDSKNWDTIKFPLPKGNWVIKSVKENIVTLVNEAPLPVQPEQEPVAWFHPHEGFYWAKPTSISAPTIADVEPLPLYTHQPKETT